MRNSYEVLCEIKEWDSAERVKMKNEMRELFVKQEKLEEKYKVVRKYADYGYKIHVIRMMLEEDED